MKKPIPDSIKRWAAVKPSTDYFLTSDYRHTPRQSPTRWRRLALVLAGKYGLMAQEIADVLKWPANKSPAEIQRAIAQLPRRKRYGIECHQEGTRGRTRVGTWA